MGKSRKGYEFSKTIKNELGGEGKEVHHIASVARCREEGVDPNLASNKINAEGLSKEDHRELHKTGSDKEREQSQIEKLLQLQPTLPGLEEARGRKKK